MELWDKKTEKQFFEQYLGKGIPKNDLFYELDDGRFCAYYPKDYKGNKETLQSRNSHIGTFTEIWCNNLFKDLAKKHKLHAVRGAVCEEIGLIKQSSADLALCTTNEIEQKPENIKLIVEIKMSIVWNWEYKDDKIIEIGDYNTHIGNPSLRRSDSMLKAIGKSINIRVSDLKSSTIPIVILSNTPITESYHKKVDFLKSSGVIQGFWSVNPKPLDDEQTISKTPKGGFTQINTTSDLEKLVDKLLEQKQVFFSGMKTLDQLGKIIESAGKESNYEQIANSFLTKLRSDA